MANSLLKLEARLAYLRTRAMSWELSRLLAAASQHKGRGERGEGRGRGERREERGERGERREEIQAYARGQTGARQGCSDGARQHSTRHDGAREQRFAVKSDAAPSSHIWLEHSVSFLRLEAMTRIDSAASIIPVVRVLSRELGLLIFVSKGGVGCVKRRCCTVLGGAWQRQGQNGKRNR